jgi:hypothetical protein
MECVDELSSKGPAGGMRGPVRTVLAAGSGSVRSLGPREGHETHTKEMRAQAP